jgi:hypothetical protein
MAYFMLYYITVFTCYVSSKAMYAIDKPINTQSCPINNYWTTLCVGRQYSRLFAQLQFAYKLHHEFMLLFD